jgi:NAD(P)-dependent dehydrogenase (short-subunit alcohol dehydrogenase family)
MELEELMIYPPPGASRCIVFLYVFFEVSFYLLRRAVGQEVHGGVSDDTPLFRRASFEVTKGLLEEFGPERVRDTPLSENAIIGAAAGAAVMGYRPVAEIMYMDFLHKCGDQLVNHLPKMHFMTGGKLTAPVVIRHTTLPVLFLLLPDTQANLRRGLSPTQLPYIGLSASHQNRSAMKVDLSSKVAVVTGSAKGIGRAIALRFAENGANIVINDILVDEGKETASDVEAVGRKSLFIQADVSKYDQVTAMIDQVEKQMGGLDILVNNAGLVTRTRVPIQDYPVDEWDKEIGVDLSSVFYCSKAAANKMIPRKTGKIINISSVAGIVALRNQIAYVAGKAGVIGLTRAMALELAPYGILVNAIAPGSTVTDATRAIFYSDKGLLSQKAQDMLSHVPLHIPAEPDDMADAALYLASNEARYVTGHVLVVDGGWTAGYSRDF